MDKIRVITKAKFGSTIQAKRIGDYKLFIEQASPYSPYARMIIEKDGVPLVSYPHEIRYIREEYAKITTVAEAKRAYETYTLFPLDTIYQGR
jgi:hypothetical protein